MTQMEKHVDMILKQMQTPDTEREDIRAELLSHLEDAKGAYMTEGFTEKQAEEKALTAFGAPNLIGRQLQEAMYPLQRELLYVIGLGTVFFGVIFYLNLAFIIHEPSPVWLAIQFLTGTVITLAAINISSVGRYFYLLNVMLLINVIWTGMNLIFMQGLSAWQTILFSLYLFVLFSLGVIAIIRNSYYSAGQSENKRQKRGVILFSYGANLLLGAAVTGISLFFLWAMLAFSSDVDMKRVILAILPIAIWLITYKFQMGYIAKRPLLSIATGFGFSAISIIVPFLIVALYAGRF